jgi:hypothetical protein
MLNTKPLLTSEDARYLAALALVAQIENYLAWGRPILNRAGQRLTNVEDAVQAVLADDLDENQTFNGSQMRGDAHA